MKGHSIEVNSPRWSFNFSGRNIFNSTGVIEVEFIQTMVVLWYGRATIKEYDYKQKENCFYGWFIFHVKLVLSCVRKMASNLAYYNTIETSLIYSKKNLSMPSPLLLVDAHSQLNSYSPFSIDMGTVSLSSCAIVWVKATWSFNFKVKLPSAPGSNWSIQLWAARPKTIPL